MRSPYPLKNSPLVELLLALSEDKLPTLQGLLKWMLANKNKYQTVEVEQWDGERWYFEIKDHKMLKRLMAEPNRQAGNTIPCRRMGFSVNITTDRILWNQFGGNCYVRDRRLLNRFREFAPVTMGGNQHKNFQKAGRMVYENAFISEYFSRRHHKPRQRAA